MQSNNDLVRQIKRNEAVVRLVPLDDLLPTGRSSIRAFDGARLPFTTAVAASTYAPVGHVPLPGSSAYLPVDVQSDMTSGDAKFAAARGFNAKSIAKKIGEYMTVDGKIMVRQYGGRAYAVFRSWGSNTLRGIRTLAAAKVVRVAMAVKEFSGGVKGGLKGSAVTFVVYTAIDVVNYAVSDTATLASLLGAITMNAIKGVIGLLAAALTTMVVGSVCTVAAGPVLAAIAVGFLVGYALTAIDERVGATAALIEMYGNLGKSLQKASRSVQRSLPKTEVPAWQRMIDSFLDGTRAVERHITEGFSSQY